MHRRTTLGTLTNTATGAVYPVTVHLPDTEPQPHRFKVELDAGFTEVRGRDFLDAVLAASRLKAVIDGAEILSVTKIRD